jgi:transposase-like protein
VQVVTSDAHQGIKNAVKAILTGASWQRCRVHFARNVTQTLGSTHSKPVNALIATIFAQTTPQAVKDAYHQVVASLAPTFPQIAQMLTDAEVDLTAFADQPRPHWQKILVQ